MDHERKRLEVLADRVSKARLGLVHKKGNTPEEAALEARFIATLVGMGLMILCWVLLEVGS